jgi:hypothetical protein
MQQSNNLNEEFYYYHISLADPSCRAVYGVGLRLLACWACGFESRRGHGCLSVVNVVGCTDRGLCDRPITRPDESYRVWFV